MWRYFIFQVYECHSASTETWIIAAKFSWKIPTLSEDVFHEVEGLGVPTMWNP